MFHYSNLRENYGIVVKSNFFENVVILVKKELCPFLIIRESLLINLARAQKSTETKFLKITKTSQSI